MHGDVRVVDDVPRAFAALVVEEAPSSIALSGGETARACYEALSEQTVEWSLVDVYFGDERWVPVDDADSNEGMARRALLDKVQPRGIHSLRNAGDTPDAAAAAYDALLRDAPAVDVVHLGLGSDGHTASLFPGSDALSEADRLVVATGDDDHPHPRLTFTYPALAQSDLVVFTVEGDGKRDAFARVRRGEHVPAAHVEAERVIWLVDHVAAGA